MSDTDIVLMKKRLTRELKILAIVQIVALCAVGLGLFLFGSHVIPNYPEWDTIHISCGVLALCGLVVFLVVTIWGGLKLANAIFLPFLIRVYVWGIFFSFLLLSSSHRLHLWLKVLIFLVSLPVLFRFTVSFRSFLSSVGW